jgi:predicted permease
VLALAGAVAGLAVAQASLSATLPLLTESFLIGQRVSLDRRVFVAAVGLAVVTSIAFGLWPAIDTARLNLRGVVWESGRHATTSRAGTRLRRGFAILEVCLAGVLLVGAGLFVRAIVSLTSVDVGFDADHVLVAQTSLQGGAGGTRLERTELFERILARMRDLPAVEAAAVGTNVPIERVTNLAIEPAGQIRETRTMDWMYVSPEYFTVFRMALRAGRPFDRRDDSAAPPAAIVNETFARTYFGTPVAALGQTIQLVRAMPDNPRTVVGVVGDVRTASSAGWTSGHALAAPPPPIIYVPVGQVPDRLALMVHGFRPVSWAVRSRGDDAALIPSIQQIMREVAPALPITRFTTMNALIEDSIQLQRTLMMVLGLFAAVALTLAAVGVYGVVAYGVALRRREIGIRMALGASVARVLRGFFNEGLATGIVGAALGLAIAAGLSRFLTAFVFGISPLDPSTYGAAAVVLLAIAGLASFIPSARAARVSPVAALRSE